MAFYEDESDEAYEQARDYTHDLCKVCGQDVDQTHLSDCRVAKDEEKELRRMVE